MIRDSGSMGWLYDSSAGKVKYSEVLQYWSTGQSLKSNRCISPKTTPLKTKTPTTYTLLPTCAAAAVLCSFIQDLKSVQALHGFFLASALCSCPFPELSCWGTGKGKPSNPGGLADDGPLLAGSSAMFALVKTSDRPAGSINNKNDCWTKRR